MLTAKDIKEIRNFLGLSPTEFAAKLGVSENTVRRWEIGDRHPRWSMLEQLNKLYDKMLLEKTPA